MRWKDHSTFSRLYLTAVYLCALPLAVLCFTAKNSYSPLWLLLTVISVFVATINIRLPKSSVISMGDVFTILIVTQFGPGPALISYWIATFSTASGVAALAAAAADPKRNSVVASCRRRAAQLAAELAASGQSSAIDCTGSGDGKRRRSRHRSVASTRVHRGRAGGPAR